ncbi:MAG: carboxypeptidase-like regulatory domain-containing protein [Lewinella sp.]|nr:carboxypeptidase-like regulatory domain-containing protein [Lewinella sp.]
MRCAAFCSKISLSFFLLLGFSRLAAQEISGTVRNSDGQGIEFANIVLLTVDGEEIIQYTLTDQTGHYVLKVNNRHGILVASSLGYQADTIRIEPEKQQIDFQLKETIFKLQSVEVSDTRIPYKVEGDTVTYQSEFFTDGTEQVIEDLVKKLPGASVGDDGTIFYKGKQVDKVLLENDELFGSKYTVGTRSLRADVVDEIQFIDHYMENALLKDVSQSDQLAMNITIKEERKKLLFGNADLGGGIPGRYEGDLNTYSLYKKHKGVLIGNAENTSNSALDMYSLFGDGISFEDPYEYSRPARYYVHLPGYMPFELKRSEVKNGRVHQGAANVVLHPNDRLKIKSYGLGFNDQWELHSGSFFRDLNLGNLYEYADRSLYREHMHGFEVNSEALWQVSDHSNIKYTFNTSRDQLTGTARTIVSKPEQEVIPQELTNRSRRYAHRLNWVGQLDGKQVLVVDGAYFTDTRSQDFNFAYQPDTIYGLQHLAQINQHRVRDVDLQAKLLGKEGSLKYSLGLKYRLQTDGLMIGTTPAEWLKDRLSFAEELQDKYRQYFWAMTGSISGQIGIARLFSKIEIGYRRALLERTTRLIHTNRSLYPNFRVGLDLTLSKKSSVLISGAVISQFPEIPQLVSGPMWSSYRSIINGTDRIDPFYSYSAMMAFRHSNNARLLEVSINSLLVGNARAYADQYFYEDVFAIRAKQLVDGGYHWDTNIELDKYFPVLSANVGLNLSSMKSLSYLLSSDATPNRVQLNTRSVELSYTTVFHGPLNVGITGSSTTSGYERISGASSLRSRNHRLGLAYFLTFKPVKHLFLKLDTRQIFTRNQGRQAGTLYLGGMRSEYQISSVVRVGCTVHNLWNTRRFNLEQLGGESYGFQEWQLNPRMILLNVGCRF